MYRCLFYRLSPLFHSKLFTLEETNNGWRNTQIQMCGTDVCFNGLTSAYERNILSFGEDDNGIYEFSV